MGFHLQVDLKFNDPFHGIIQADYDRSSACRVSGKGAFQYRLELPLKGCGTIQVCSGDFLSSQAD